MSLLRGLALAVVAALPVSALAAGGHDAVGCTGCHSIHTAKGRSSSRSRRTSRP